MKDNAAVADVKDIAAAVNRMIDYGAQQKGSQTAQRSDFLASIASWGKGAIYRAVVSDTLAADLLNPATRMEMAKEAKAMQEKASSEKPKPLKITVPTSENYERSKAKK
jgi:hypothetical protein